MSSLSPQLPFTDTPALVIFSGGQDSTTCLGWALNRFAKVLTLGYDYGQRHLVEMDCRKQILELVRTSPTLPPDWKTRLGEDTLLELGLFNQIGETAMTSDIAITANAQGLPNTFVPGRNLVFLIAAAALAWRKGIRHIIMGVCETDFSGYPDCRDDTIKAMQVALNLGMDARFILHTPLMWLNKTQTWELAQQEGHEDFVELVRTETHTCYLGERGALHP
ncbi:MAG: 7-cyano-7-deazaguanine synthase QueC, partial [Bilophila sp.]